MTWLKIDRDLRSNKKFRLFMYKAELSENEAIGALISLWSEVHRKEPDGVLDGWSDEDIASAANVFEFPKKFVDCLVMSRLCDRTATGQIVINNWMEYAGSYAESARKRAWREQNKKTKKPKSRKEGVPSMSRPESKSKSKIDIISSSKEEEGQLLDCSTIVSMWNLEFAGTLPRVAKLTDQRKVKLKRRLKSDHLSSVALWSDLFQKIKQTPFCLGENQRGWRVDFDWIIENDENSLKVIEGRYDHSGGSAPKKMTNAQKFMLKARQAEIEENEKLKNDQTRTTTASIHDLRLLADHQ